MKANNSLKLNVLVIRVKITHSFIQSASYPIDLFHCAQFENVGIYSLFVLLMYIFDNVLD